MAEPPSAPCARATDACAIYDVSVEVLPAEEECHSMQHMCIDDCRVLCEELEVRPGTECAAPPCCRRFPPPSEHSAVLWHK